MWPYLCVCVCERESERERERERERECVRVIANLSSGYNQDVGIYRDQFCRLTSGFLVFPSKLLFVPKELYFIRRHVWRVKMFHKTVSSLKLLQTF